MAITRKPNTICRNPNCTHGEDGGRKQFYACLSCVRTAHWKAYTCCFECYEEYTRIVLANRAKEMPERIDLTKDEIQKVMETPAEKVLEYSKNVELADYVAENPDKSLTEIIDVVNNDIDKAAKKKNK